MGTLGGHLYDVWKVYRDPKWSYGVIYMKLGKCMGTLGVIEGRLYDVWEVYGDLRRS